MEKAINRDLAPDRIDVEQAIGKLKVFAILCQRNRPHSRRFRLRFNLLPSVSNLELTPKS